MVSLYALETRTKPLAYNHQESKSLSLRFLLVLIVKKIPPV